MTLPQFASHLSTLTDSDRAIDEVVQAVSLQLGGEAPDLVACFVSHHHGAAIETLGPRLAVALNAQALIGCTGESIVGTGREIERGAALSVWGAILPDTEVRPFAVTAEAVSDDTLRFNGMPDVRDRQRAGMLLVADPFSFPAHAYLEVLNRELPGVPAIGGLASGGQGAGQNLLFTHGGVVEGGAIGVVVEGAIELRPIVSQGCRPVGKPFVITSCRDNFVLKLSGKPALQALMDTLQSVPTEDQKLMQRGPFLGLALDPRKSSFLRGDFLARGIVGLEKEMNAIAVADNTIRNGMSVQFLVRDAASAGEDLTQLVKDQAGDVGDSSQAGVLLFSCNGRGTRMFRRPDHDVGCLRAALSTDIPTGGFFALGEIGPVGGRNLLHGFSASLALFHRRG